MNKAKTTDIPKAIFVRAARVDFVADMLYRWTVELTDPSTRISVSDAVRGDHTDRSPEPPPAVPWIIINAFAIELYLKSLILAEGRKFCKKGRDGHNLKKLFHSVSKESQDRIRSLFDEFLGVIPDFCKLRSRFGVDSKFDTILEESKLAFLEWRYPWDENPHGVAIDALKVPTRRRILEVRPEWKAAIDDVNKQVKDAKERIARMREEFLFSVCTTFGTVLIAEELRRGEGVSVTEVR
jgi:hypothetical protein